MPALVIVDATSGWGDYTVTGVADVPNQPLTIGIIIGPPLVNQLTIYVVALLPLLLAIVLALVWLNRRDHATFDLAFAAGMIAAMLAILPLRAVLVPPNLGAVSPTFVDDILILGFLFVAGFLFAQYARSATRKSRGPTPPLPSPDDGANGTRSHSPEPPPSPGSLVAGSNAQVPQEGQH